ncbi:MAG: aldo/keto reductase [Bacillota bacterium]|jgi:predicted aldo/keto reductase-like oxidoreductase|nr:aldo/keto reductase [Candidatus Fermentithermobacillaceae bacterium]HOP71306.1 aldo/keto reductase [Bacillota bacterium]HPT36540.1 aldo/keto reductase [Bacillota bacterium]HPZ86368.1 aldo/keto reductase [Bacillota bacterium]HQD86842.1 aldo/keto reductase [Bacillota bacterium]
MQRRKFGFHDFDVSALGFGCMRLPVIDNQPDKIDEAKTAEMIYYAVDNGVDYIDTAYSYHREQSEVVLGRILKEGYRDKVNLATKCPTWLIENREDFDKYLDIQLTRLQTDRIDMYLMHSLNKDRWNNLLKNDVFSFIESAKQDGRIRYAGFSFHDDLATFKSIVDAYDWDFCQIQYNYMDEKFQAGTAGLKYAAAKNLAVVIMEPLRGGRLVRNIPAEVKEIMERSGKNRTSADWALRWVWNHPEVTLVLSGMGKLDEVKQNIETAGTALPNSLTQEELEMFEQVKAAYRKRIRIDCTACEYCLPCPQDIVIPKLFDQYNDAFMYNTMDGFAQRYDWIVENWGNPEDCIECGQCEEACPQNLPIRELMKEIRSAAGR